MKGRAFLIAPAIVLPLAVVGVGAYRYSKAPVKNTSPGIPSTVIKRGDVTFTVTARGELQGGKTEMLTAPMTGGNDLIVTSLREPGEVVKEGETVAQFDTTEQPFKLKEAEAVLAEADQQLFQTTPATQPKEKESPY